MFSEEQVRKMLEEMFNEGRRYESASYQPQSRADAIKYYSDKIISAQQSVHADAGDSAAYTSLVHASAESTSKTETKPAQRG